MVVSIQNLQSNIRSTLTVATNLDKQQNSKEEKKLTGFQLHPEHINKNGRPHKGYSITETFQQMLGAKLEVKHKLVDKILQSALAGDMTAAKMIWQYMDGMPLQSTDITSLGEKIESPRLYIPEEKD
jgi:hypothetical protein